MRRRTAVSISRESIVHVGPMTSAADGAVIVTPAIERLDSAAWAADNRPQIDELLTRHGAVLFRGFVVDDDTFDRFARSLATLMTYRERSSPRSEVRANIYTSTDYPPDQEIFPHNEHSYALTPPTKLFFYCARAAAHGGQTPLVDIRRLTSRLDETLRRRFERKGWMWTRNFGDGFGLPWQTAFGTSDRAVVEAYCASHGLTPEWRGEKLRTRQVRPVTLAHPVTLEPLWFNHATFFHVSTLPDALRLPLLERFSEEELPNNTYYGDGAPIEPSVLETLRGLYLQEMFAFDWQPRDVLLIDNIRMAHARRAFAGERRVLVAMGDVLTRTDIDLTPVATDGTTRSRT